MLNNYPIDRKNNLYILHKEDIEKEATFFLKNYAPECLENAMPTPLENILNKLKIRIVPKKLSTDGLTYGLFIFNKGIVELFNEDGTSYFQNFNSKTILIDSELYEKDNGMFHFTLGHEIRSLLFAI